MAHSDYEKLPTYSGMLIGGGFAVAAGGIGLSILLTVGITTKVFLPTGFASLTMGSATVGVLLLAGRMVLRKVAESRLDMIQSTTAIFDEVRAMRDEVAALNRKIGAAGEAFAEAQKTSARIAGRQDEVLAMLSQYAQRFENMVGRLKTELEGRIAAHVQHQHPQRRGQRKPKSGNEEQAGKQASGENVVPLRARGAADALRRLTEKLDPTKE